MRGNINSFLLLVYWFWRDGGLLKKFSPCLLGLKVLLKLVGFDGYCYWFLGDVIIIDVGEEIYPVFYPL